MTSEKVLLTLVMLLLTACTSPRERGADALESPYASRRVWAVAPLRNESGSLAVDGAAVADKLTRHLENASNIDTLPVNRVIQAMEALHMRQIASPADALKLLGVLGVDGLVVGTISTYDPYDPPKAGMAIELYSNPRADLPAPPDLRRLSSAATDSAARPSYLQQKQPVNVVSAYFDAADPDVRRKVQRYAYARGQVSKADHPVLMRTPFNREDDQSWRFYRINTDLYLEFVSYVMCWRLLDAERQRVEPPPAVTQAHDPRLDLSP